jgi:ParB-like chromosome segregation protein Spo0J
MLLALTNAYPDGLYRTIIPYSVAAKDRERRWHRRDAGAHQRENLHPLEEAEALLRLKTVKGYTDQDLAQVIGKSRKAVNESLLLTQLPDAIKAEWRTSAIASKSQLLQVLRAGSSEKIEAAWASLKTGDVKTVRELRKQKEAQSPKPGRPRNYRFEYKPKVSTASVGQ